MLLAMSRKAVGIELRGEERSLIEHIVKSPSAKQREVLRARIILQAAAGKDNLAIADGLGLSNHSVGMWRNRFAAGRVAALGNRPKKRTPIKYTAEDRRRVVEMACTGSPEAETHWSVRTLAKATGVGRETVRAILGEAHLQPHRVATFTQSNDPEFREKLIDVVGLYTNPPDNAVVLCVDEKTQLQALDRTQPQLPMRPDQIARRTHDYKRNGTTQLFAALDVAVAKVQVKMPGQTPLRGISALHGWDRQALRGQRYPCSTGQRQQPQIRGGRALEKGASPGVFSFRPNLLLVAQPG